MKDELNVMESLIGGRDLNTLTDSEIDKVLANLHKDSTKKIVFNWIVNCNTGAILN